MNNSVHHHLLAHLNNLDVHGVAEILQAHTYSKASRTDLPGMTQEQTHTYYLEAQQITELINSVPSIDMKLSLFKEYLGPM